MKKYFIILLALCNTVLIVTSCKSRCERGREKALNMPKDTKLVGVWRMLDIQTLEEIEYMILKANGVRKEGFTPENINSTDVWYTIDNYFYTYNCNKSDEMTEKYKYSIVNDTLKILIGSGYGYRYQNYVRVKER